MVSMAYYPIVHHKRLKSRYPVLQNDLVGHLITQNGQLIVKDHGDIDDLIDLFPRGDDSHWNHSLLEENPIW